MRVMEINFFEFYCKFYYFDERFKLRMILCIWIIHDRVQSRWKMIQKNNEKSLKQMSEKSFQLDFNSMESYHPKHLLVYSKFLKNLNQNLNPIQPTQTRFDWYAVEAFA